MLRTDDSAALAVNWRSVLAVDAGLGVIASLAGVVVAVTLSVPIGAALIAVGAMYTALVVVRARRWARLRREAGLSGAPGPSGPVAPGRQQSPGRRSSPGP
jgi:hypothetical protein